MFKMCDLGERNAQNGHFLNRQNEAFSVRWRPPQRATLDRAAGADRVRAEGAG